MKRDLNLFRRELLPQPVPLAAEKVLVIQGVVLVAMCLVWAMDGWRINQSKNQVALAEKNKNIAEINLEESTNSYPPVAIDEVLKNRVEQRENEVRQHQNMLIYLQQNQQAVRNGFSPYLLGLSRQHVPGLWLESIQVGSGFRLSLSGGVLQPDLLPKYIEKLASDSVFEKQNFETLRLLIPDEKEKNQVPMDYFQFELKADAGTHETE